MILSIESNIDEVHELEVGGLYTLYAVDEKCSCIVISRLDHYFDMVDLNTGYACWSSNSMGTLSDLKDVINNCGYKIRKFDGKITLGNGSLTYKRK